MKWIDAILNKITMYRLLVYGLGLISFLAILFAIFGSISIPPMAMLLSLAILCVSCFVTELIMARIWSRPFNAESWLITALIIFLIFPAATTWMGVATLVVVGMLSSASKYLIAWRGKHIFNPAAFAVAVVGLLGITTTTWWVGNSVLWPFTFIFGMLVVRKIRRFTLLAAFGIVVVGLQAATFIMGGFPLGDSMKSALLVSPFIFMSTIMLTEPATMPPRRSLQIVFGVLVAILYVESWKIGSFEIYPEVALLIGNIFAFAVSPKFRAKLRLQEIQKISRNAYNFVFVPERKFAYRAGQYMEWTLPHVAFDSRGNRRSFTLASSPTEDTVQLGVKFYQPSSTYKYTLSQMKVGDEIYVSQLAGNFTLDHANKKLAFIAGGIGITPFRSMIKYVIDTKMPVDITLLYFVGSAEEISYGNIFNEAAQYGVKCIPVITNSEPQNDSYMHGQLDAALLDRLIPDSLERTFYISGPNAMVEAAKHHLEMAGVGRGHIRTDHFSGY